MVQRVHAEAPPQQGSCVRDPFGDKSQEKFWAFISIVSPGLRCLTKVRNPAQRGQITQRANFSLALAVS